MEEVLALNAELADRSSELEANLATTQQELRALQCRNDEAVEKFEEAMEELAEVQGHFEILVQESAQTQLVIEDLRRTNAERYEAMRQQLEHRCAVYVETIRRLALELGAGGPHTRLRMDLPELSAGSRVHLQAGRPL